MLTLTERNTPALDKIRAIVDESYDDDDSTVPTADMVKDAIDEAHSDTGNFTGERSISWKAGVYEHTVTSILANGRIVEIIVQSVKGGGVRILRKRKIRPDT